MVITLELGQIIGAVATAFAAIYAARKVSSAIISRQTNNVSGDNNVFHNTILQN